MTIISFIKNLLLLCGISAGILLMLSPNLSAQNDKYSFRILYEVKTTPVKDQAYSSTCWSFGTVSFIESELLRMGKGVYNLSEMFVVRKIWPLKASNYIRWQGKVYLTPGGQSHDVMRVIRLYGIVPEQVYPGTDSPKEGYDHSEMDTVIFNVIKTVLAGGKPGEHWLDALNNILDVYLGEVPDTFLYEGKTFTPRSFAGFLGIHPDDYVEITSYMNHPYYKPYVMDSKYNWSHDLYYNVPLEDFAEIINYALKNNFSVAWDGDISEEEFSFEDAIALVPEKKWEFKNYEEKRLTFIRPEKELEITPEIRLATFLNGQTTIDHIMHITGIAQDQNGKRFYYVKNSWGRTNAGNGYLYMSENYLKLKTVAIMVHKDAIPPQIRKKLGF